MEETLEFNMSRYGQVIGATRGSAAGANVRSWKFLATSNSDERGIDLILVYSTRLGCNRKYLYKCKCANFSSIEPRQLFNTSGNFGLGTSAPSRKFEIHENNTYLTIGEKTGYAPELTVLYLEQTQVVWFFLTQCI